MNPTTLKLIRLDVIFYRAANPPEVASEEPFQVNYVEPLDSADRRFRPWLEKSLVRALDLWRRSFGA